MTCTILWVDDDRSVIDSMAGLLADRGIVVQPAYTFAEAEQEMLRMDQGERRFEAAVIDLRLEQGDGLDLVHLANQLKIPALLLTGYATVDDTIRAFQHGAADVLQKPVTDDQFLAAIDGCRDSHEKRNPALPPNVPFLVGTTSRMKELVELVEAVADTPATVLITGESGTGKSLLARELTRRSTRADAPFVEVSCGALSESLLESELFGHVRGAFTGAEKDTPGKIGAADGGTIFLDEIGTASQRMQVKLLRFLQSMEYEPVGSSETVRSSARMILATNEQLEELVAEGRFREDLYYRVNVINIRMPALRERREDIPILAIAMLEEANIRLGKQVAGIHEEAMGLLRSHGWPGNIRELKNVIERAVLLCQGDMLTGEILSLSEGNQGRFSPENSPHGTLKEAMREPERQFIQQALLRCNGNRGDAAHVLGINRTTLYKKMKRLGLDSSLQPR